MAEDGFGARVRVVRCPKCQKLLPELADLSVYRCGGCGATLQSKKQIPASGASLEKSDSIKHLDVFEQAAIKETDSRACEGIDHEGGRAGKRLEESSPHTAMGCNGESVTSGDCNGLNREQLITSQSNSFAEHNRSDAAKHQCQCEAPPMEHSTNVRELGKADAEDGRGAKQHEDRPSEPRRTLIQKAKEMSPVNGRDAVLPDEGLSDCRWKQRHVYGNVEGGSRQSMDGASRVNHLEQDRAKLLRMLDELRDQVRRTCEVSDKQKTGVPRLTSSSSYANHDHTNWFPESSSSTNPIRHRYFPILHDHHIGTLNFCSSTPSYGEIPGLEDPFAHRRVPFHQHNEYPQFDSDPVMPYHHGGFHHQPTCSCLCCYQRLFPHPARVPAAVWGHQKIPYHVNNHDFYAVDAPSVFGTKSSNVRVGDPPFHKHETTSHSRTKFSKNTAQSCEPIDGASPFIVCSNCFELLHMPEESLMLKKNKLKMRCGSCSNLISIRYDGSKIVMSAPAASSHVSSKNNNSSNHNPVDGIQSTGEKLVLPCILTTSDHKMIKNGCGLHFPESEKVCGLSLSSCSSGYDESPDSVISQKDVPHSPGLPLESQVISRVPSFPFHEHFGYSISDQSVDGSGNGSGSKRTDQVRSRSLSGNFKQSSVKDVQVATVLDLSDDKNPPNCLSQDSWDMVSNDETQCRTVKAGDSFLAGLIRKSFRPFNQSMGNSRFKVSINGHPVPDRLIRKVEKQAGSIYPGDYWYDYRAGFWGVMGHPCLGIIPPFIEEFNYPMPKNCARGNTGVLVNGRELHQKDFDLLIGRGLPPTEGCSYVIEISGKVWDESSGEELDCLGKLAPTVEKVKHGFGMRVPKVLA